jgi:hypothetical protein
MNHNVIIDEDYYVKYEGYVLKFHLDPPLPEDKLSYSVKYYDYDKKVLSTYSPQIFNKEISFVVNLETSVMSERKREYPYTGYSIIPTKMLRVSALSKVIKYGGHLRVFNGRIPYIDLYKPSILPIEVIKWNIEFCGYEIKYLEEKDKKQESFESFSRIKGAPSIYEVFNKEKKEWPNEPRILINKEKFFFKRWLSDHNLTMAEIEPLYKEEILDRYEKEKEEYDKKISDGEKYYQKWLYDNEIFLTETKDIWEYLNDEALPNTSKKVKEDAKQFLEKSNHLELLSTIN